MNMGLGSALGSIGRALVPRPGMTSYRTPPFLPEDEPLYEDREATYGAPDESESDAPPTAKPPVSAASAIGGKGEYQPKTFRPEMSPEQQKAQEIANQGAPLHPKHSKLRSIGEALTSGFLGPEMSETLWDSGYSRQRKEYEHSLGNAARAAEMRQKAEKGAADVSETTARGALTGKQAENYESDAIQRSVGQGGELQPDNPQPLAEGQKPREGSDVVIGGKKVFYPSRGQQAKDRKLAEQENWLEVPAVMADKLKDIGVTAGEKVPPSVYNKYQAMVAIKDKQPNLVHREFVDENKGDVTIIGFDPATMQERSRQVIPGVAKKRPQVSILNSIANADDRKQLAQSLASGELIDITKIASLRNNERTAIWAEAKRINPEFDISSLKRQIEMEDYWANKQGANQLQSFGTFLEHAGQAVDAMEHLKQTDAAILNKSYNWLRSRASSPEYRRALAAIEPVKKEFESFLLNNRALYAEDRESADKILNHDLPLSDFMAAIGMMGHTVQARYNEGNQRYRNVRKKNLQESYPLTPEAINGARKIGVNLGGEQRPAAPGGSPKPIVQYSESTKQYRYSIDGGQTWLPGQPPK
jgi:hypothetical protein